MHRSLIPLVAISLGVIRALATPAQEKESLEQTPYLNTWLVAGTFDNARNNVGFEHDWIDEAEVQPREGMRAGGQPWRYFDDRLFSRNYDDYQDLFSYFRIKRNESIRAKIVYAHVYVHSHREQPAELRVGADNEFKAWLNGVLVASSTEGLPQRDQSITEVTLVQGWNRLLMKIGNREAGRLGFYARLTGPAGTPLQGVTYAVNPPGAALAISTKAMTDANTGTLPTAWREWSYVGARLVPTLGWPPFEPSWLCKPEIAVHASDFALLAEGGTPPYRWGLSEGVQPDWQEYLRLQIALIGDGFIANIDHSPTIRTGVQEEGGKLASLDESVVLAAHRKMAAWANPEGLPPLYESYTWVNPGPLVAADWGYNTINLARNTIYLHMIETPYGKTGMPKDGKLSVGPLAQTVVSAVCMNTGQRIEFQQNAEKLVLELSKLTADPVDTIVKLSLAGPHPEGTPPSPKDQASPPGNLAWHKPARLLSLDCTHSLIASGFNFAHYGTDGFLFTHAQGGMEWPWTYQVDLEEIHPVNRLVVHFGSGYPTEYEVQISADGESWQSIHRGAGTAEGKYTFEIKSIPTRYVRVKGIKPDGPDREGSQMSIAELEVYAAE